MTQRMLAFARQQDLRTTSADLETLVRGMQDLLRRSLGPDTMLRLHVEPHLPPAEVDAHQVELCGVFVNAPNSRYQRVLG